MFKSIATAISMMFGSLTTIFSAVDHSAKALEALAITAEETAGAYCDEARRNRAKQLAQLDAELAVAEKQAVKAIKAA